ncbi:hypothetical protein [Herbaspirillum rubrisubalbicans]|uniref:hypothetical protein n=1 Tax=Herbaspirillum rubrisubalbicans TaxID=80842 RepID=UPI0011BE66D6|nr:hypothetical protein [Herbaspirillum rubrisubalbicans]
MNAIFLPLFSSVCVALIAGLFSVVALINSKEQKTSEFRQAWIDALRKEIADFISAVYSLQYYYSKHGEADLKAKDLQEIHIQYGRACVSVRLRINPNESDPVIKPVTDRFLTAMSAVQDAVNAQRYADAGNGCNAVLDAAKPLLKLEWERVKSGEKSYRDLKRRTRVGLCLGVALFVIIISTFGMAKLDENKKDQGTAAVLSATSPAVNVSNAPVISIGAPVAHVECVLEEKIHRSVPVRQSVKTCSSGSDEAATKK